MRISDRSSDVCSSDLDGNGFDLAAEIRSRHDCGISMLTALDDSVDRIRGFDSGADIYLVKDSTLREIEAAIRSLLRRTGRASGGANGVARRVLNGADWLLTAPSRHTVKLTATELDFLKLLCGDRERVVSGKRGSV